MTLAKMSHVSCQSTFSKGFSSETTRPISFKFHMQPSSKGGKKVCIFGSGHMTKMATMPIYGKNLKISEEFSRTTLTVALKFGMWHHALLTIILALLSYVYKRSVTSYSKQIAHCSLGAHGINQDLMVLLFDFFCCCCFL